MKKLVALLLTGALSVTAVASLAACNNGGANIDAEIEEGQKLTTEELVEKAKGESGDFIAYGNTSRITSAMDNFVKKYGTELGLTGSSAAAQKKNDAEIYQLLQSESESANKSKNASMVLIQDSAQLDNCIQNTDLLANYIPKGMDTKVDEKNRIPLAHQFINKLFMYNTAGSTTAKFDNVWQLAAKDHQGKIFFKSPKSEQVNMNFLIMLTSDEWSGKLEKAYKSQYDNATAEDVGEGKTYKNYGYKWIAEFLANCDFTITSDTTIAQRLSDKSNAGNMGLFVLSKLRDSSVYGENLAVSAWDKDANDKLVKIDPFAGFMYSIYAQLANNGPRPYTAMLFVNYLMTEEGFAPWKSLGGYSSNKDVPVYEGNVTSPIVATIDGKEVIVCTDNNKDYLYESGKDGDKKKIYTYLTKTGEGDEATYTKTDRTIKEGDKVTVDGKEAELKVSVCTKVISTVKDSELSFWTENLVVEDGAYISSVKAEVQDWINLKLA